MNDLYQAQRAMRALRTTAIQRGVIAVMDVGSSKVACLILRFDGPSEISSGEVIGSMAGQSSFRVIGSKEPLRFEDEFVRHKILDIVGDMCLLGKPLKADIIAVRPGHSLNSDLTAKILESVAKKEKLKSGSPAKAHERKSYVMPDETELDIRRVLDVLPHRFPFVMIDRVVSIEGDQSLTGIKNVSINEPFFTGHFPGHPVMPGVLQLEAMAQAAGILLLRRGSAEGKVAFFMSADKVKFRKPVVPGDQLEIRANLVKVRGNKIATAEVTCMVSGKIVSSASLMFAITDASDS